MTEDLNAICEHGSQRRKCPHCENAEYIADNNRLEAENALQAERIGKLHESLNAKDGEIAALKALCKDAEIVLSRQEPTLLVVSLLDRLRSVK